MYVCGLHFIFGLLIPFLNRWHQYFHKLLDVHVILGSEKVLAFKACVYLSEKWMENSAEGVN